MADEFVTIARVVKTQGRRGEVYAALFTDFPELFASRRRVFALEAASGKEGIGARRELLLEEHWLHKGQVVLKFAGIDSMSAAEALVGCEIQVPRGARRPLEEGAVYISDLEGCEVYDAGKRIGVVQAVRFGGGEAPLLVIQDGPHVESPQGGNPQGGKEYLVPFAAAYIGKIALEQKRLEMELPEGMLDLDAPLTREEKSWQNGGKRDPAD